MYRLSKTPLCFESRKLVYGCHVPQPRYRFWQSWIHGRCRCCIATEVKLYTMNVVAVYSSSVVFRQLQQQHHRQQQQQQQHQIRQVTSKKRQRQIDRDLGHDPFLILGVSRKDTYGEVKSAFIRVAMQLHPDTSSASTTKEKEDNKEKFVAARKAFEAIVAGPNGLAILESESENFQEEDDFDTWFKMETGHDMPYMDAKTMKEVAEMTETSDIGLDRDGGMWTLAKMVTQNVKAGGDGRDILRLESGTIRDQDIDGILRRRRRW